MWEFLQKGEQELSFGKLEKLSNDIVAQWSTGLHLASPCFLNV
jgi:hypothetical protein